MNEDPHLHHFLPSIFLLEGVILLQKQKAKQSDLSKHAYQAIAAFTVSLERVATQRIFCALSLQLVLDNKENLLSCYEILKQ